MLPAYLASKGPGQELTEMYSAEDRRERLVLFFIPTLIVVLGCGFSLVPPAALVFLTAWVCLSFPLAVVFGHCALSED
jgi:hypothetical protein